MRGALLAVAVVVSLWPAAVVAYGVDRVLGGGGDDEASSTAAAVTTTARTAPAQPRTTTAPPATSRTTPSAAAGASAEGLDGLNRLRDETAGLIAAVEVSSAAAGRPDAELAVQALDVEAALVDWQERNEGVNADAEFFAQLFADIASATADFATAPSAETKRQLDRAIARHRRETLQGGM